MEVLLIISIILKSNPDFPKSTSTTWRSGKVIKQTLELGHNRQVHQWNTSLSTRVCSTYLREGTRTETRLPVPENGHSCSSATERFLSRFCSLQLEASHPLRLSAWVAGTGGLSPPTRSRHPILRGCRVNAVEHSTCFEPVLTPTRVMCLSLHLTHTISTHTHTHTHLWWMTRADKSFI